MKPLEQLTRLLPHFAEWKQREVFAAEPAPHSDRCGKGNEFMFPYRGTSSLEGGTV
jgi:hypothetical protein